MVFPEAMVEPPLAQIHEQNRQRADPVPLKVIDRLADKLEPPTVTEAHGRQLVSERVSESMSAISPSIALNPALPNLLTDSLTH